MRMYLRTNAFVRVGQTNPKRVQPTRIYYKAIRVSDVERVDTRNRDGEAGRTAPG
jgi:hypothetical protein